MDDAAVGGVDELVHVHERLRALDVAGGERVERGLDHLLRAGAHVLERLGEGLVPRRVVDELRQLGDGDAVVRHAFEVEVVVEDREHEPEVHRCRRLSREQRLNARLDVEVAAVDLVVESDHLWRASLLLLDAFSERRSALRDELAFLWSDASSWSSSS